MKNRYEIREDVTVIYVNGSYGKHFEVLIDTEDLARVDKEVTGSWFAWTRPNDNRWYVLGRKYDGHGNDTCIWLHRLVMDADKGSVVDHVYHDPLDNRKSVLRVVSHAENMQNRQGARKNTKSGVRGVIWDESRHKWQARAKVNGREFYLGRYDTVDEAESVVVEFRKNYMPFSLEALRERSS